MAVADAVRPLHADALCRHLLASHDCAGIPARVHAAVLPSRAGGPRCARCGFHSAAAGLQGSVHCGALFWDVCRFKTLSTAPFSGSVTGESLCMGHAAFYVHKSTNEIELPCSALLSLCEESLAAALCFPSRINPCWTVILPYCPQAPSCHSCSSVQCRFGPH